MSTTTQPARDGRDVLLELVRPEVIAAHDEAAESRLDLRGRSYAPVGFLALAVAAALVVWAALTIHVDQRANGQGRVMGDGRSVVMALPIGVQSRLRPGLPVRIQVGGRHFDGRLVSVSPPQDAASVSKLIGRHVDGDAAAVARATLGADAAELGRDAGGAVSVRVKQQRLWDLVAPGQLLRARHDG